MDYVRLVLADTKGPFSQVIKWRTWSPYSHSALILDNNIIQEATVFGGVHKASLRSLKDRSHHGIIVKVPVKDHKDVFEIAESINGLKYDLKGALGTSFNRDWQEDDAFWCSEGNYFCIHKAGNEYYRAEAMHTITPHHLYMLNFEILDRF